MAYCITEVRHREFSDNRRCSHSSRLRWNKSRRLPCSVSDVHLPNSPQVGQGFQMNLADDLEAYLERTLKADGVTAYTQSLRIDLLSFAESAR